MNVLNWLSNNIKIDDSNGFFTGGMILIVVGFPMAYEYFCFGFSIIAIGVVITCASISLKKSKKRED